MHTQILVIHWQFLRGLIVMHKALLAQQTQEIKTQPNISLMTIINLDRNFPFKVPLFYTKVYNGCLAFYKLIA